jgi:hypothetical protein
LYPFFSGPLPHPHPPTPTSMEVSQPTQAQVERRQLPPPLQFFASRLQAGNARATVGERGRGCCFPPLKREYFFSYK